MSDDAKGTPEDILALLAEVYGPSEAEARDERVQMAVRRLEHTHRQASLAMRNLETIGATRPESKAPPQPEPEPAAKPASRPRGTQPAKKMRAPAADTGRDLAAPLVARPALQPEPEKKLRRIPQRRQVAGRLGKAMELESGEAEIFFESD